MARAAAAAAAATSTATAEYPEALLITIHGARSLAKADLIGTSDPFAVIKFPSHSVLLGQSQAFGTFKTHTISETINPEWNKSISLLMKSHIDSIPIEIYDEDPTKNDLLGKTSISIDKSKPFKKIDGWYNINKIENSEVHLSYMYVPFHLAESIAEKADLFIENENALKTPQLTIVRARYRSFEHPDVGAEVTPIIVKHVTNGRDLKLLVDNKTMKGDAAPGKVKVLEVWFTRRLGAEVEKVLVGEGEFCHVNV